MSFTHRVLIKWMVAVAVHLPFPVCDGDNLRSGEIPTLAANVGSPAFDIDIDFVLLGCDLPDDPDDGPIDDDPEDGSNSYLGVYFTSTMSRNSGTGFHPLDDPWRHASATPHVLADLDSLNRLALQSGRHKDDSLGTFGQNEFTILRC